MPLVCKEHGQHGYSVFLKIFARNAYIYLFVDSVYRPVEMKKILGGLRIMKYCRPPWLADEENFAFQIVLNG